MTKATKGLLWSSIDRFSVQGVQFLISILIARLVTPEAYGVVVMVQVFISFGQIFIESGFKEALIQKKDRNENDYYTVFIFNLLISIFLYLVIFLLSPLIARFYNQPQLTSLTRVISLNLIFSSLSITQLVKLTVELDFKTQTKAKLSSVIISGIIGIACAYYGFEAWALVIYSILQNSLTSFFLILLSKWMPKLIFSLQSFKQLFKFGSKLLVSNLLTMSYIQITNLLIGKFYKAADLAFYDRSFHLSLFPSTNISTVISRVSYPILCQHQNNRQNLIDNYYKYLHLSCYCIFPLLCLCAVLSKPLILVILTEKWVRMAPLLKIFCGVFFFYPIIDNGVLIVNAIGRSDINLKVVILKGLIAFSILIITLFINIEAIAWGLLVSNICEAIITIIMVKKVLNIPIKEQIFSVADILFASIISGLISLFIIFLTDNIYIQLFVGGFLGLLTLLFLTYVLKMREKQYISKFFFYVLRSKIM